MSGQQAMKRLVVANPTSAEDLSTLIPAADRAALLERIVGLPRESHADDACFTERSENDSASGATTDEHPGPVTPAVRERRPQRRTLVLLAFGAAAILSGSAYAVVHELIVGGPAPPEVQEQPARFGHSAELIPVPHPNDPRLDRARVAAVLDSSVGPVYLFSSGNANGLCASSWIEGDRGYQGRLNISSSCGTSDQSFYSFRTDNFRGKRVRLFSGRAGAGVARLALRFGTRTVDVPLTDRWFLAEFTEFPDEFISYDAEGRVLEQRPFLSPTFHLHHVTPHAVTQPHEIADIGTHDGSEHITLSVAPASGGGYCQIVRSDERPTNSSCSISAPQPDEIGVDAMNFGGAPGGVLLLVGPVGSDISTLVLSYQDGRTATLPITDGWVLYEVVSDDYAQGRRPNVLVGRDSSGEETTSKNLPWTTSAG